MNFLIINISKQLFVLQTFTSEKLLVFSRYFSLETLLPYFLVNFCYRFRSLSDIAFCLLLMISYLALVCLPALFALKVIPILPIRLGRFRFPYLSLVFQPFELQLLSLALFLEVSVVTHPKCLIEFYGMSAVQQTQTSYQCAIMVLLVYVDSNI